MDEESKVGSSPKANADKPEQEAVEGHNAPDKSTEADDEAIKLEKISRLLARKRANAVAAAAAAATSTAAAASTQGTPSGDNAAPSESPGGTLSHWSKLRTTVQIASAVKQRSKRRYNHHRQDSFLRKFSTRNNSNIDLESDSEDEGLSLQVERKQEEKRNYKYVLSPEGTFMMYWLFILTLAVLYNLWTCIAREAFREIQLQHIALWTSLDIICDTIYLTDILVQFRTGYLEQGLLVYDSKKLSKNYYSSSDFRMDIACLVPLDFLQFAIGWHPILRFPRFLKVYRSLRCSHMLESRTPYPNLFRVANLTHILFLGAHWFAAFFYLISEAENFVGDWTYPKPIGEYSSVTRKYLYSLFWSTLTLTTIGDLPPPTTNWEYVFVIVSYLIGVFIFATIVGQVGNVITNRNASRQEFEKLLDGAKFYMQSHNVPKDLQKRVQRWYDYVWSRGRMNGSLDISSLGMLPDKLKTELALNVNLDTLKKVTIFQECQPEFLHDLVLKMKAHIFTPGDLICRRGEVAREMFIIADGVVEIISDRGTVLTSMSSGDFFGEIGILNLHGGINRRTADVRSLGYSELFVLSREDVLAALKDQPDAEEVLVGYATDRLKNLVESSPSYVQWNSRYKSKMEKRKREYGEKRLKEIEAHNKKMSDPESMPGSKAKSPSPNNLQINAAKSGRGDSKASHSDRSCSKNGADSRSKRGSLTRRMRNFQFGRKKAGCSSPDNTTSASGGERSRNSEGNETKDRSSSGGGGGGQSRGHTLATIAPSVDARLQKMLQGTWSKFFSHKSVRGGSYNVSLRPVDNRAAKTSDLSSSCSSSPETAQRKLAVKHLQCGNNPSSNSMKKHLGGFGGFKTGGGGSGGGSSGSGGGGHCSAGSDGEEPKMSLSTRLSSMINPRKYSPVTKYSAVKPDTSDSDSPYLEPTSSSAAAPHQRFDGRNNDKGEVGYSSTSSISTAATTTTTTKDYRLASCTCAATKSTTSTAINTTASSGSKSICSRGSSSDSGIADHFSGPRCHTTSGSGGSISSSSGAGAGAGGISTSGGGGGVSSGISRLLSAAGFSRSATAPKLSSKTLPQISLTSPSTAPCSPSGDYIPRHQQQQQHQNQSSTAILVEESDHLIDIDDSRNFPLELAHHDHHLLLLHQTQQQQQQQQEQQQQHHHHHHHHHHQPQPQQQQHYHQSHRGLYKSQTILPDYIRNSCPGFESSQRCLVPGTSIEIGSGVAGAGGGGGGGGIEGSGIGSGMGIGASPPFTEFSEPTALATRSPPYTGSLCLSHSSSSAFAPITSSSSFSGKKFSSLIGRNRAAQDSLRSSSLDEYRTSSYDDFITPITATNSAANASSTMPRSGHGYSVGLGVAGGKGWGGVGVSLMSSSSLSSASSPSSTTTLPIMKGSGTITTVTTTIATTTSASLSLSSPLQLSSSSSSSSPPSSLSATTAISAPGAGRYVIKPSSQSAVALTPILPTTTTAAATNIPTTTTTTTATKTILSPLTFSSTSTPILTTPPLHSSASLSPPQPPSYYSAVTHTPTTVPLTGSADSPLLSPPCYHNPIEPTSSCSSAGGPAANKNAPISSRHSSSAATMFLHTSERPHLKKWQSCTSAPTTSPLALPTISASMSFGSRMSNGGIVGGVSGDVVVGGRTFIENGPSLRKPLQFHSEGNISPCRGYNEQDKDKFTECRKLTGQVLLEVQKILEDKLSEIQISYQENVEYYVELSKIQEKRIQELEREVRSYKDKQLQHQPRYSDEDPHKPLLLETDC